VVAPQSFATGVLPSVGLGWTAAMAADASRAADASLATLAKLVMSSAAAELKFAA
jgi:hypothetical protein